MVILLNKLKPKSEFAKNVLTLMTGTTIAQAIPIAISPILTRIYTPEDFGTFALFASIVSILSVISTGRYEFAIMLPKKNKNAINIVVISILLAFFLSILSLAMLNLFNKQISSLFKNDYLGKVLYFVPILVFFDGIYQSMVYWYNRNTSYGIISRGTILNSTSKAAISIMMGINGIGYFGLVLSTIIGRFISLLYLSIKFINKNLSLINIKKTKVVILARKYQNFPKKSATGALFNVLSYELEIILLSIFYLPYYLGLFYFINKIVSIPRQFLSASLWQVFLSVSGKSINDIFNFKYNKQKKIIVYTTFPIIFGLFIYSDLVIFFFGEEWKDASVFILPLIIAMHINFVVASFSLFVVINRPDAEMYFNVTLAIFKVISIVASYYMWHSIYLTIFIFSFVQFAMFYILGTWNYVKLKKSMWFFTRLYVPNLLTSLAITLVFYVSMNELDLYIKVLIYFIMIFMHWMLLKNEK